MKTELELHIAEITQRIANLGETKTRNLSTIEKLKQDNKDNDLLLLQLNKDFEIAMAEQNTPKTEA